MPSRICARQTSPLPVSPRALRFTVVSPQQKLRFLPPGLKVGNSAFRESLILTCVSMEYGIGIPSQEGLVHIYIFIL